MGNRSLESRNSKRAQYHPQSSQSKKEHVTSTNFSTNNANNAASSVPTQPITVGALEVQNVKRAINRYGTLPKGARIGAYLESLRQTNENGAATNQKPPASQSNSSNGPLIELPPPPPQLVNNNNTNSSSAMSPRAVIKAQPQMIRSNSSGGVTMTNSASSSLNKLQRHRTTADGQMITFSSFRGTSGSPKRSFNPALADLEFPPPPLDLPPPPEEFDVDSSSSRSNLDALQLSQSASLAPSNDVSNTEPSVEEASSRFGVSLRKREPSTDSCSSLGSPATGAVNEIVNDASANSNPKPKEKMETKLVAEIKERNEQYQRKQTADVPNNNNNNGNINKGNNNKSVDHVSQLVNELAETMNLPKVSPAEIAKKNSAIAPKTEPNGLANTKNFKAQLKKVDPKKMNHTAPKEESNSIVDFKSRLRRVENNNDSEATESTLECKKLLDNDENDSDRSNGQKKSVIKRNGDSKAIANDHDILNNRKKSLTDSKVIDMNKKTEVKIEIADDKAKRDADTKTNTTTCDDEDKRKSTGSISSLKKLWEAKEGSGNSTNNELTMQLSPKLTSKNIVGGSKTADEEFDTSVNKKPTVPLKPTKLVSIYATPIQVKLNSDVNSISSTSTTPPTSSSNPASATAAPNICSNSNNVPISNSTTQVSREAILDLIQLLEGTLKIPINSISASQWLQLSDKLNILQNSCVSFADKTTMAPHSKFQFRELVTRVENQSRSLRSAGSKNIQDNEKLVSEVGQSLKQISNALHR